MISQRGVLVALTVVVAAWTATIQAGARSGVKYAFLVGCSEYDKAQLKPLPQTINDVEGFKKALLATGFKPDHTVILHDKMSENRYRPFKHNIQQELTLLLDGLRPQDTIVVALSGQGLHFKGDSTGYFCPVDARVDDKNSLIAMDGKGGLFEILKNCSARQKLLIVNACRNDPANDIALAANRLALDDEDRDDVPEGIAAIYSCRQGQKSYYDPDRKISLFFDHLIRAWQGDYHQGGKVTLEDVFDQVVVKTRTDANKTLRVAQTPVVRREYKGDWVVTEAWTRLFNGKDLTGWKTHPDQPGGWTVENGLLTGRSVLEDRVDARHLFSQRGDYRDFHLRVEARINKKGNSGVYFRSNLSVARLGLFPDAYEAQISHDNLTPRNSLTGSLYGLVRVDQTDLQPDEWFTMETIAQGYRIIIRVNGATTVDHVDSQELHRSGHIALQALSSPGDTIVQFRKIEIKELP